MHHSFIPKEVRRREAVRDDYDVKFLFFFKGTIAGLKHNITPFILKRYFEFNLIPCLVELLQPKSFV